MELAISGLALTVALAVPASAQGTQEPSALREAYPQIAALPPKQLMQVYGQTIRYYDVGKGLVVMLVHGTNDRSESWAKIIPELAKSHRVIAMDQLGCSESAKPIINCRIETWVNMLGEMLRLLAVKHFTLVGESLSG
jgi:pimeloyl-ACP methyl ester carboxylesterase